MYASVAYISVQRLNKVKNRKRVSLERYKERKTLDIPVSKNSSPVRPLSVLEVRQALSISTRATINAHLKALGLFGRDYLLWDEVCEVLALQLFLGIKPGQCSRQMYLILRDSGNLTKIFNDYQIDLDSHIRRIQDAIVATQYKQQIA